MLHLADGQRCRDVVRRVRRLQREIRIVEIEVANIAPFVNVARSGVVRCLVPRTLAPLEIETPIAISWDDQGRLYVCEMRGYMNDIDGKGEDQPLGRISRLEDTDGDGRMDKATVFVDKLVMPRAVMALGDGALVAEPPNVTFYRDTNGDGVADQKEIVSTSYGRAGGQPEHMANGLLWCLDYAIWSAGHPQRFRFRAGKYVTEATRMGGQWGLAQDDAGRRYYNYNSDLLRCDLLPPDIYLRNPNLRDQPALNVKLVTDQSVHPLVPTPGVNRGYMEKQLQKDGKLATVTGTCGPCVYRGDLMPELRGNVFCAEPCGMLVKRLLLSEEGGVITGKHAYADQEFLASTDERFRPVNINNGPDGALYIVDIARGIVQHKAFITHYLKANIVARKLEQPVGMGRIWRIVPKGSKPQPVKLPRDSAQIVPLLAHANGHVRDTAQRVLVERGDKAIAPEIAKLVSKDRPALAGVHALWTLDGLKALTPEVLAAALGDDRPEVRAAAVQLSGVPQVPQLLTMTHDADAKVRLQLAAQLSQQQTPQAQQAVRDLLAQGGSTLLLDVVVSGMRSRELEMLQWLLEQRAAKSKDELVSSGILQMLANCVMTERRSERVAKLLDIVAAQSSARQLAMIKGIAGAPVDTSKKFKPQPRKLLYLKEEPAALKTIAAAKIDKALLKAIDASIAWPGKPGVPPPPVIKPLTASEQKLFDQGKLLYAGLCGACHQPTGTGLDGLAPPLVDSEWVLGKADVPARIVLHGVGGDLKVAGRTWRLEMPPLGVLSDEQIAGVLTYIRREWEHGASPVKPEDIAKLRSANAARTKAWTMDELKAK